MRLEARSDALAHWLRATLGATLEGAERLAGGAIQENWRLDTDQGPMVLRKDAASTLSSSHSRAEEFCILRLVFEAGVCVPEPLALCADSGLLGVPFYVMQFREGVAQARKIVRDPRLAQFGPALTEHLGRELAKLHRIKPPLAELDFLSLPDPSPAQARIDSYRRDLDRLAEGHPALEYVLNWLEDNQPSHSTVSLCHADYRTGNYLVNGGQLTAILDWEFATWSDPMEDIGWICARCWRFGNDENIVGGVGTLDRFAEGYASEGGQFDAAWLPYWQVMAEVRWAVIALLQAERCFDGEPTLELALSAPLAAEMEWNALNLIGGIG